MVKEPKVVGECHHCGDPILDFQEMVKENGMTYHKGCQDIFEAGVKLSLKARVVP